MIMVLDWKRPALHGDDRSPAEELREPLRIERGGGDHDLQIGAPFQEPVQVAEDEVDVQRALVRFVDDEGVVFSQRGIAPRFRQENPVRHELDPCGVRGAILETDLEADLFAKRHAQFLRHPLRHRSRREPARLGAADPLPLDAASEFQRDLGKLCRFAGPRVPQTMTTG